MSVVPNAYAVSAWVWLEGYDDVPMGAQHALQTRVVEAVVDHHEYVKVARTGWPEADSEGVGRQAAHTQAVTERSRIVMVAVGQSLTLLPELVQVAGCTEPLMAMRGLVTTARVPKVDGHLVRPRGADRRAWLFVVGVDPYALCAATGLIADPTVESAGFISAPSDNIRQVRKHILGFGEAR